MELLDGYGDLGPPEQEATLVADIGSARPSAETPPGLYDRDGSMFALNAVDTDTVLTPLGPAEIGWRGRTASLQPQPATPLWP
ncbi:MAG: hypothetical protein MI724_10360, partial [Spirochaetales bacterium]|nr:hypothetical protein [Spirochaetales bacterium]